MGVKDQIGWVVQWHPSSGARVRRLVLGWRGVRRLILAAGVAGSVVAAGGWLAGLDESRTRHALGKARQENEVLKAQQDALHAHAQDLARRSSEALERGRLIARLLEFEVGLRAIDQAPTGDTGTHDLPLVGSRERNHGFDAAGWFSERLSRRAEPRPFGG